MAEQQVRIESALADETFQHLIVDAILPNGQIIRGAVVPMNLDRQQIAAALIQHAARLRAMPGLTGIVPVEAQEYDRLNAAHQSALNDAAAVMALASSAPPAEPTAEPIPDPTPEPTADPTTATPANGPAKKAK